MDILSHGLWGVWAAKLVNQKSRNARRPIPKLDPLLAGFWGFAPDLVAFMPMTMLFVGGMLTGSIDAHDLPRPRDYDAIAPQNSVGIYTVTHAIYNVTHSILIFMLVFGATFIIRRYWLRMQSRAPLFEMGAWAIHLLMDVPTHSHQFYATPIFWPLSEWRFDGIPWANPWILAVNYGLLAAGFWYVRRRRHQEQNAAETDTAAVLVQSHE